MKNTSATELGDGIDFTERFVRGDKSRTDGGSGLGLYLVKMILDRHGAVCTIENTEEGVKATVRF